MGNDGVSTWACKFLSLVHGLELTGLRLPNDKITCFLIVMLSCSKITRNGASIKINPLNRSKFWDLLQKEETAISRVFCSLAALACSTAPQSSTESESPRAGSGRLESLAKTWWRLWLTQSRKKTQGNPAPCGQWKWCWQHSCSNRCAESSTDSCCFLYLTLATTCFRIYLDSSC